MKPVLFIPMFAATMLSACATTYDPAEVCTAAWIEPRAERAIGDVEQDTRSLFNTFKSAGKSFENGKMPNTLQMIRLTSAVNKFVSKLENGRGMKDLRVLSQTCNDPEIIKDAMSDFMESKGLPAPLINIINDLEGYKELLDFEAVEKDIST